MPKKLTFDELLASLKAVTVEDPYGEPLRDADGKWMDDKDGEPLWKPIIRSPHVFKGERPDQIILSAEDGGYFADYYGEFRGGDSWVHESIEEWAKAHGYEIGWRDPGSVSLYPA